MSSAASASTRVLLSHRPYRVYLSARAVSSFAYQIAAVAVGWQVYAFTRSAFALGMVGLVQFMPTALLVLVAGHAADHFDRQRVVQVCQFVEGLAALFLAWGSYAGWLNPPEIFAAVTVLGTARAFEAPASAALLTGVTPEGMLQKGTALSSAVFQLAVISGPALGGLAYAVSPGVPYTLMTFMWVAGGILNGSIVLDRSVPPKEPATLDTVFAGVRFVRDHSTMLGTISLDLFAVLLGGATALLPICARDILHTGP